MRKPVVISVKRPRNPTPAEVEAANAWEKIGRSTLVFDFASANGTKPEHEEDAEAEGGLKGAIQRWLAAQL